MHAKMTINPNGTNETLRCDQHFATVRWQCWAAWSALFKQRLFQQLPRKVKLGMTTWMLQTKASFARPRAVLKTPPVHVRGTHRLRPESPRELNGVFCTLGSQVLRHFATSRSHQVARTSAAELTTATDRETGQPCSSQRPLHCTSAHRGCPRSGVEDDFELSSQLCV